MVYLLKMPFWTALGSCKGPYVPPKDCFHFLILVPFTSYSMKVNIASNDVVSKGQMALKKAIGTVFHL